MLYRILFWITFRRFFPLIFLVISFFTFHFFELNFVSSLLTTEQLVTFFLLLFCHIFVLIQSSNFSYEQLELSLFFHSSSVTLLGCCSRVLKIFLAHSEKTRFMTFPFIFHHIVQSLKKIFRLPKFKISKMFFCLSISTKSLTAYPIFGYHRVILIIFKKKMIIIIRKNCLKLLFENIVKIFLQNILKILENISYNNSKLTF